eukprot:s938_g10.t1
MIKYTVLLLVTTLQHLHTGCNKVHACLIGLRKGSILDCAEVLFCKDPCPASPGIKYLLGQDSKISLLEFQNFVGRMGGIRQLFEQRRLRISTSRKDVCDYIGIAEGARVRAHYYVQGQKSRGWREAQAVRAAAEAACFATATEQQLCCSGNRSSSWWGMPEVLSLAHLILFHISQGTSCFASLSLSESSCCGSNTPPKECWDDSFSAGHCCGHTSGMGVEADLQPSGCWFGKFTQEYCCGDIEKGEEQGSRVPSLTHAKVLRHGRSVATTWALEDAWEDILRISPGFGASIALHALADILKNWLGGVQVENWVFENAAQFLRHYRSAVGRIPLEDLPTAGGLRIADLDQAVSLFMKASYEVAAQVALRERFTNREKDGMEEQPGSVPRF